MMENLGLTVAEIASGATLLTIGIAYIGGILTAFTPCVYPMIPITIGTMGAKGSKSLLKAMSLAAIFVLGLTAIYSSLGFLAASTGYVMGSLTQKPAFILSLAALFVLMGLSLVGLYEIRVPSRFQTFLARYGGSGYLGAFTLGMVSGVLAAPCSGPVVVGILAFVASKSNPFYGFLLLFSFSLGLGTPFFLLATFSKKISAIPRTGIWTEWVKHVCGLALIIAAGIFAAPFLSTRVVDGLLLLSAALFVFYLPKLFPFPKEAPRYFYPLGRALTIALVVLHLFGTSVNLPPSKEKAISQFEGIEWITTEKEGLLQAKRLSRPIMIDFWADWCVACHELDNLTYSDPKVAKILRENFVSVKLDASEMEGPIIAIIKKYGVVGLPTVVFLDSEGKEMREFLFSGFVPPESLLPKLEKVLEKSKRGA